MNQSVFVIVFLMVSACNNQYAKKNVAKMLQADTILYSQQGKNVTIKYTDSGFLKAIVFSKVLNGFKKDGEEIIKMPEGVKADFYNRDGIIESFLTAKKGISYQTQKITEVSEDVVVRNNKGERLNTEHLIWDQNKQIIFTEKFVKITTEKEVITGEGLIGKQDFSEWTIKKPRGIIQIAKDSIQ